MPLTATVSNVKVAPAGLTLALIFTDGAKTSNEVLEFAINDTLTLAVIRAAIMDMGAKLQARGKQETDFALLRNVVITIPEVI